MAPCKYYSFLNFLFFCIFLQEDILVSAKDDCVNPAYQYNQKINIEYFYDADAPSIEDDVCKIISQSNGMIRINFRMTGSIKDQDCMKNDSCVTNRRFACDYKKYPDIYNDCSQTLPIIDTEIADCVCDGSADNILTDNEAARTDYGVPKLPALVVDHKYDPCFTDYSFDGMKNYFCTAYGNALPLCEG